MSLLEQAVKDTGKRSLKPEDTSHPVPWPVPQVQRLRSRRQASRPAHARDHQALPDRLGRTDPRVNRYITGGEVSVSLEERMDRMAMKEQQVQMQNVHMSNRLSHASSVLMRRQVSRDTSCVCSVLLFLDSALILSLFLGPPGRPGSKGPTGPAGLKGGDAQLGVRHSWLIFHRQN